MATVEEKGRGLVLACMPFVPKLRQVFVSDAKKEQYAGMVDITHRQRILTLASQRGLLRSSDLEEIEAPRVVLTRLTAEGLLERVGRGLYRIPDSPSSEHETLAMVATKAPRAVFCLLSALQFHELTTQLPWTLWIAMPRGSHVPRMDYPPLTMIQVSDDVHAAGIEVHRRDGVDLRVYSPARTVVDCFKHRNKVGLDVALEALKDARAAGKASIEDLWRFGQICRVSTVIRPYLEAVG